MPKLRPPLIALLCLSVLAGSTSTSIQHSHDQGWLPHGHGSALVRWLTGDPALSTRSDDFACRHSHLVILGFELYGGECPAPQSPPRMPCSPDDTEVTLGFEEETPLHATRGASDLGAPQTHAADLLIPLPSASCPVQPTAPATRCALCARARGERSGVHLV